MKEKYTDNWTSNPRVHRKGKGQYIPGLPKKKAYPHPIDESGPPIKVPKPKRDEEAYKLLEEVLQWINMEGIDWAVHNILIKIRTYLNK